MRVLILGITGAVARRVAVGLHARGHTVVGIDTRPWADAPQGIEVHVEDLRKRGHKAYRQSAYVPERGLWHRVRVGPFKNAFEAEQYKKQFEKNERVAPFVVDPHKQKQAEEARAAKLEARVKRFGRP